MQQAFLDVPPRRRSAIPSLDLASGVGLGVGLCALAMVLAASLDETPPPAPDEPLTVSIGVLATSDPGAGGSGSSKAGGGKAGKRRQRKDAVAPPASDASPTEPLRPSSSASTASPLAVPNPWSTPAGLPSLGELGEPAEGSDDAEGETEGGEGGEGGGGGGTGDGGLGAYRSQLAAWLAAHFHVEGSGLDAKALRQLRVRAVLELDEARVVTGYQLRPTGTPAVDEAARRALEAVKGQPVPAPPPGLGALQRRINVVLTCRPDTCD